MKIIIGICLIIFVLMIIISYILGKKIKKKVKLLGSYGLVLDRYRTEIENSTKALSNVKDDLKQIEIQKEEASKSLKVVQDLASHVEEQRNHYNEELRLYQEQQEQKLEKLKEEWNNLDSRLCESYANKQAELLAEIDKVEERIAVLQATQDAINEKAREARTAEDFLEKHSLCLDTAGTKDIEILNSVKDKLSNPVAINKIIWSNYYQPLAKTKFPIIIGKATCCGVYKLTNTVTEEVYVGQARDVCERWKEHCKAGLEVSPAPANKLYKSIIRYGLNNFTFEVLEECDVSLLNEKEKFYIDFFDSYNFGLNSTRGNN